MSINALLSIYALVFKSAIAYVVTSCVGQLQWAWFSSDSRPLSDVVLFDNAGRGPWGLLAMLWAHRLRQPLAILAAVIMISGLAIDPFIQQLVRPFDCSVPLDHDVATLPCTNRIHSYMGPGDDEQTSALPLHAVGTARFSSDNETPWTCSTGNCIFPEVYSTLGVCSACEDVSVDAVVNLTPSYPNATTILYHNITTSLSSGDEGHYWASNYNQLNTTFCFGEDEVDVAHMDIWSPLPSAADTFSVRIDIVVGKTSFSEEGRLISTGKNITGCDTTEASNNKWACRGYGAASSTLKPCVRTYSARIEAGTLKEQLISQSPDMDWGSSWGRNYYGLLDTHCVSAQQAAFLTSRGYELRNTTRWIPFYGDVSAGHPLEQWASNEWSSNLESLLRHKCVYLISPDFINKVAYANVMGAWNRTTAASQLVGTVRGLAADATEFVDRRFNVFDGPELLQDIYDYGRVDFERVQSAFKNISDSLTTYIRTHGNASHSGAGERSGPTLRHLSGHSVALDHIACGVSGADHFVPGPGGGEHQEASDAGLEGLSAAVDPGW
ncbi:hypothetical protein LA080_005044 [Diaporthe eres]|nr:hypothetical protein LA080_005044 [Diaporthe eres]